MDDFWDGHFTLSFISWIEIVIRIFLAAAFGFILGFDRNSKNKPIDFRAYMIVAVTTCVIALMGQELYNDYASADGFISLDLGKVIAGVLTGIGFLGAGAIIKVENNQVVGTATGASIWASGGIGLSLGFGFYGLAVALFGMLILILMCGGALIEKLFGESDQEKSS